MQYFSLPIFYAQTWPDLKKIVLSSRIRNFKTQNNRRTRISRWLGRENEENVARTRNCCGWPFLPCSSVVSLSEFRININQSNHFRIKLPMAIALKLSLVAMSSKLSFNMGTNVHSIKKAGILPVAKNHLKRVVTCKMHSLSNLSVEFRFGDNSDTLFLQKV